MCSFLVTSLKTTSEQLLRANKFQQYRGPDATHIKEINNITFLHNLLSITGKFTPQPFEDNGVVCIYNGEVYNYKDIFPQATSDGECLLYAYQKYGEDFIKQLDGEFAIVLWDFNRQKIIFGLDTFGCKPLFYSFTNGIHFASYESALTKLGLQNVTQVQGNQWFVLDVPSLKMRQHDTHTFEIDNEHKTTFDDWNIAFVNSIKKRAICDKPVMMGVSEGYDSGSICSVLVEQNIPFKMYSVNVLDKISPVLQWRHGITSKTLPKVEGIQITVPNVKQKKLIDASLLEHYKLCTTIYNKCEPYSYTFYEHSTNEELSRVCRDTYGFLGAGLILTEARNEGYRVCLSGLAGDIIGSPEINQKMRALKNINHVVDFDDNNVYSCEYCCGVHGIEIRYPFLDVNLWQETFWLDKAVYTKWKHPQRQLMLQNKFPFVDLDEHGNEIFEKVGFFKELPSSFHLYRAKLGAIVPC